MVFLPLLSPVIAMLILWLVQAGFLYIAGSAVSEEGTKVTDALIVAAIGSLAYEAALWAFGVWVSPLMEVYPMLLFWLLLGGALVAIYVPLIMHFFDTSFGGALLVGVLAFIVFWPVVVYLFPVIFFVLTHF